MHFSSLLIALPLANAAVVRYTGLRLVPASGRIQRRQAGLATNYTAIPDDYFPGGKFGLSNQVSVLTNFFGLGGVTGDVHAMITDLETIFPSLKTSGYEATLESGLKGGLDGLIDTLTAAASASTNPNATASSLGGMVAAAMASGLVPTTKEIDNYYALFKGLVASGSAESLACSMLQDPKNAYYIGYLSGLVGEPAKSMEKDACEVDNTGGTGAYSAHMIEDTTLPDHTIYVPKNATGTLPVVLFGNMLCLSQGAFFKTMLTEIASHGFMVVASGSLKGKSELTRASMLTKAVDWANGPAAQKYGKVDASSLAVVGHGCGGLEALSASYQESRVTYTVLLNSGVYEKAKLPLLQGLKAPLAYFVGGQPDIGFPLAERDYPLLNIPVLKASIKVGHLGTFYQKRGGAQGQALVKYLSWKQKGDSSAKALFCSPADGTQLVKTGWSIESKNGMC